MGRNSFDYSHGDAGSKPSNALNFEKNERPKAQNFDWWWYTVIAAINAHANEFDRLDSNNDGAVDNADYADDSDKLDGNDWSDIQTFLANNYAGITHDNTAHNPNFATQSEVDNLDFPSNPHDNSAHDPNFLLASNYTPAADTHSKYTDSEAISATNGEISQAASSVSTLDSVVSDLSNHDHSGTTAPSVINPTEAHISSILEIPVRSSAPSNPSEGEMWIRDDL